MKVGVIYDNQAQLSDAKHHYRDDIDYEYTFLNFSCLLGHRFDKIIVYPPIYKDSVRRLKEDVPLKLRPGGELVFHQEQP